MKTALISVYRGLGKLLWLAVGILVWPARPIRGRVYTRAIADAAADFERVQVHRRKIAQEAQQAAQPRKVVLQVKETSRPVPGRSVAPRPMPPKRTRPA